MRPSRPFLKWVGGKGQLLTQLGPLLPRSFRRYFEPFAGGAALFFHLQPERAVLTDVNAELIDCYRAVRDHVSDVVVALRQHRYDRDHYYAVRAIDPLSLDLPQRAARTIFLNRAGFNGLYRVNRAGRFNVPFGRYDNPTLCKEDVLRACAHALRRAEFAVGDFTAVRRRARRGDFVYFDPPYVPLSTTAHFTSYAAPGFRWEQQLKLADVFRALAARGVHVMLSNADVPAVRELYKDFVVDVVRATRSINANAGRRGAITEIVVRSVSSS